MEDWEKFIIHGSRLTEPEQQKADAHNAKLAVENEIYLADQPELKIFMSLLIEAIVREKPEDAIRFSAEFFSRPDLVDQMANREESQK